MTGAAEKLGSGRIVLGAMGLLARHAGFLLPLAFVPMLALTLATYALAGWPGPEADPAASLSGADTAGGLAAVVLNIAVGFVVTGVMCLAALDAALGKRHGVGDYLGQTLRHAGPVVALGTLLSLATALGTVLLVIPGLYVAARWLPWVPAVLFENLGWGGMGRAQELTEGRRWPLVGAIALMVLVVLMLLLAAGPILLAVGGSLLVGALIEAALAAVYYGLVACFTALVYLRLRELAEGLDAAAVAATID